MKLYQNYFLGLLTGLLFAGAWPTYGFTILIFVAFVPLLIAERNIRLQSSKRTFFKVFLLSYLSFLVWNIITTWWISKATLFGGIFAVVVNSLLMTIVFSLYHLMAKKRPQHFALIFLVSFWLVFEKFHLNWDLSWPWLNLGNVFATKTTWIQWYDFTGVFGGSLWVWWTNILFFSAFLSYEKFNNYKLFIKKFLFAVSFVVLGIALSWLIYYKYEEKGAAIEVVVLQPNTDPYSEKYYQSTEEITQNLLTLAQSEMDEKVSFVLAPETVFSRATTLENFTNSTAYSSLQQFFFKYPHAAMISGIDLYKIFDKSIPKSETANAFSNSDQSWYEAYNAALFLKANQQPEIYKKSKLVVGVEHFPFRSVLKPLLGDVMIDLGGTVNTLTPQPEVSVFSLPEENAYAAPVICYESIYGEFLGSFVKQNANFFAIITNDSWWGRTQGHKQLLSYARLHAISHRRAVARSANSGISAFINQKGEVIKSLPYMTKGALKGKIRLNNEQTFYTKYGDYIARIASLVAALLFLTGFFTRKREA